MWWSTLHRAQAVKFLPRRGKGVFCSHEFHDFAWEQDQILNPAVVIPQLAYQRWDNFRKILSSDQVKKAC
jgi:hypothetical protein